MGQCPCLLNHCYCLGYVGIEFPHAWHVSWLLRGLTQKCQIYCRNNPLDMITGHLTCETSTRTCQCFMYYHSSKTVVLKLHNNNNNNTKLGVEGEIKREF